MKYLLSNPTGRLLIHIAVCFMAINHFQAPKVTFFKAAVVRYLERRG